MTAVRVRHTSQWGLKSVQERAEILANGFSRDVGSTFKTWISSLDCNWDLPLNRDKNPRLRLELDT